MSKTLSHKYSQNLLDSNKKIYNRCNKTADKIKSASKSSKKLYSQNNLDETDIPKWRYISLEKRQQIIDELRLV